LSRSPSLSESLTECESRILRLLATDLSPKEMAGQVFVSVATVRTHIRNIYAKLDVHSRFEAVKRAKELGLL
jgi:LuxR family maltose regulon positive regulatory protein